MTRRAGASRPLLCAILLLQLAFLQVAARAQRRPPLTSPAARPMITGPVTDRHLVSLPGSVSPLAQKKYEIGPVEKSLQLDHILLMLRRSPERARALEELMRQQYDANSANFHRWLTPQEFGELYGPAPEDVQRVTQWLQQNGFTVNRVAPGSLFIDFSGSASAVETAFHTSLAHYRLTGETTLHYANSTIPSIPAALAPVVAGFRSLDNFHPRPLASKSHAVRRNRTTGKWAHLTGGAGTYLLGPGDFAEIYGVKPVWSQTIPGPDGPQPLRGAGQTIGVPGDTDLDPADIQSFRDQFGITALGPQGSVQVEHPPASVCPALPANSNDVEGYIDAEWAGALAPDATVDFVACGDQGATSGADLAAAYLVQDPDHAAKIGVLSTSYGYCERFPVSESADFYVALWQQAAAEGITVIAAAGDSGGAECDEFSGIPFAFGGLAVNAEASTPYNIAAGGTDFSDVFSKTTSQYWAAENGADLSSAKSYIPEMTWNDSCASPLVLAAFGNGRSTSYGPDGFCTVASREPISPFIGLHPFFFHFAGSGGLSTVSSRPPWQKGVPGIPGSSARALPDISMFASSGYAWGHTLLFCDSKSLPPGTTCDFSNPENLFDNEDGGTSFVAPAFAGVMALINQKYGRQGQANNVLYALAARQYVDSQAPNQPSLATCAAYLGSSVLDSCYFHDVSSTPNPDPATQAQTPFLTGDISVPCTGTATAPGTYTDQSTDPASNPQDCYGYEVTVSVDEGRLTLQPNYYGILSADLSTGLPAFQATPGYDMATGLGSPNVAAMMAAPEWAGLSISPSALPNAVVNTAYSQSLTASGRIAPYSWSIVQGALPQGLSLDAASGTISGTPAAAGQATFTVQVADSETPPATAAVPYSLSVTSAPLPSSTTLSSSSPTVGAGQNVTFTATVSSEEGVPTGSVTFYNGPAVMGATDLSAGVATFTTSFPSPGQYSIHAAYAGNAVYLGSESSPLTQTVVTPGVSIDIEPPNLVIPFGQSGAVTVTLHSQGGFSGDAALSCGALPGNLSCSFSPASLSVPASGNAVTATLTVGTVRGSASAITPSNLDAGSAGKMTLALVFWLPVLAGFRGRRRKRLGGKLGTMSILGTAIMLAFCLVGAAGLMGCGNSARTTPDGTYNVPVQVSYPGGSQSATLVVQIQ